MDARYYEIFRQASQEDFYNAINDPEDELYDLVWDLFETLVIEPAEIFDPEFREANQFRYSISDGAALEFFPEAGYFDKRIEPNPYRDDSDPAGVHLRFSLMPHRSCLFQVGFQTWGSGERSSLKKLWRDHRKLLADLFRRVKPMIWTRRVFPAVEHAAGLEEMLDTYFGTRDQESFISFNYAFAQTDDVDVAQNFMVAMALLYHAIKEMTQHRQPTLEQRYQQLREFYSGHIPELPAPLPCVELAIASDTE